MPGYVLVEQKNLAPPKAERQGIHANSQEIGFGDFLRELDQDEFPFNENSSLRVVGLEELLLASRPNMDDYTKMIRHKLQSHANDFFTKGCGDVQIVFRGELIKGEKLFDKHVTAEIPIHLIFGSPQTDEINGQKFYKAGFNLSGN